MDGFYDWFLELISYGENWDGSLPLYFGEIAFTILLVQYAFVIYRTIKSKGNVNKALFGHMPFLSKDKLSMVSDNEKVLIYFARFFGVILLIALNYTSLSRVFIEGNMAMEWTIPTVNFVIWLLCYGAQEASYK